MRLRLIKRKRVKKLVEDAKKIQTIITRIDPECITKVAEDFDDLVNEALADGWTLVSAGMNDLYFWAIVEGDPL